MVNWKLAECKDKNPELFFSSASKEAKEICAECPIKDACLQWALDMDIDFGIWGGLTERERRRFVRLGERSLRFQKQRTEQLQDAVEPPISA